MSRRCFQVGYRKGPETFGAIYEHYVTELNQNLFIVCRTKFHFSQTQTRETLPAQTFLYLKIFAVETRTKYLVCVFTVWFHRKCPEMTDEELELLLFLLLFLRLNL